MISCHSFHLDLYLIKSRIPHIPCPYQFHSCVGLPAMHASWICVKSKLDGPQHTTRRGHQCGVWVAGRGHPLLYLPRHHCTSMLSRYTCVRTPMETMLETWIIQKMILLRISMRISTQNIGYPLYLGVSVVPISILIKRSADFHPHCNIDKCCYDHLEAMLTPKWMKRKPWL